LTHFGARPIEILRKGMGNRVTILSVNDMVRIGRNLSRLKLVREKRGGYYDRKFRDPNSVWVATFTIENSFESLGGVIVTAALFLPVS